MRIAVIGGGISGLACAFRLQRLGLPVTLFEQTGRVGGVICTVEQDGFLFELGPQSFLATPPLLQLIEELGLDGELVESDPRAPRYVLLGGKLHRVPLSPLELLATNLLSRRTKFRLLTEPLRRTRPPESDESLADFVRRKFGDELLERLAGPFVSGLYAGDPEKLSFRSAFPDAHRWEKESGSLIRGAAKSRRAANRQARRGLCSFRRGNETLLRALGKSLGDSLRLEATAQSAARGKSDGRSQFDLRITRGGRSETFTADALVVGVPAQAAGQILKDISPRFPAMLSQLEYAPVAEVGAGFRREQVAHRLEGFGFLVPRSERMRLLGTVWNSSIFQGRAPQGMVSMTSFVGGATDPNFSRLPCEEIAEIAVKEAAMVLGINGSPVTTVAHCYAQALPQYNLGHAKIVSGLDEGLGRVPGLFLVGNYLEGPSIGACVEKAFRTAEAVQAYLASLG